MTKAQFQAYLTAREEEKSAAVDFAIEIANILQSHPCWMEGDAITLTRDAITTYRAYLAALKHTSSLSLTHQ